MAATNRRITLPPRFGWKAQLHCKKNGLPFSRREVCPARESLVSGVPDGDGKIFNHSVGGLHTWSRGSWQKTSTRSEIASSSPTPHSARRSSTCVSTPSCGRFVHQGHGQGGSPTTAHAHQVSQGEGWLSREVGAV
jgi:hypothetical protein